MTVIAQVRPLGFQSTPDREARALPAAHGLTAERQWLRGTFARAYEEAAAQVPAPGSGPDAVADAVAVRLYLSSLGVGLNTPLRNGEPGPHVPFARCVAAGLARLPVFRGATTLTAELTADSVRQLRARRILTDWGFTQALTEPHPKLAGTVDVLIWSMTARRTRLLEPEDDHFTAGRVIFLPGTAFKILHTAEPVGGGRARIYLRELEPEEPTRGPVPFDDLTLSALRRAGRQWQAQGPPLIVGPAAEHHFTAVPGLRQPPGAVF